MVVCGRVPASVTDWAFVLRYSLRGQTTDSLSYFILRKRVKTTI